MQLRGLSTSRQQHGVDDVHQGTAHRDVRLHRRGARVRGREVELAAQ